ncbi:SH3 domain-containing protein [Streptomyces sp. AK02-01A]|uniref:SH3 domain-containing protein n=1 Tax=Streptomyces sp. AK02-01A TaxID=3028648 RepID=UPI0029BD8724|nr:SH3 domain-containing protein [Streptomyces sp. AK02-01A]MDX3854911.1 SH3 domain-containing protein [Streptomyces sp. AK02-01A]
MRASSRIAACTAVLGAFAIPLTFTSPADATPQVVPSSVTTVASGTRPCDRPGPWVIGTSAVTIRSKATTKSTALGVLYRGHKFTVTKSSGNWHYLTDRTTGVKGWVSGTYVYRDAYFCLD